MATKSSFETFNLGNHQTTALLTVNLLSILIGLPLLLANNVNDYICFPYIYLNMLSLLLVTSVSIFANTYFGKTQKEDLKICGIEIFNTMFFVACLCYLTSFYFMGHNVMHFLGKLQSPYFNHVIARYVFDGVFGFVTLMSLVTMVMSRVNSKSS